MTKAKKRIQKIGVIMGGTSRERDISIVSGKNVLAALKRLGYEAESIDAKGYLPDKIRTADMDAAFIALHGRGGEDGTIQGFLEYLGIPYTGSGVTASALGMDKMAVKRIMRDTDLPTPDFLPISPERELADICGSIEERFGFPVVIKPNEEGSSIGVKIVDKKDFLLRAVQEVRNEYDSLFAEEFIAGREMTVGILGTGARARPLPVLELETELSFYDYEAKYTEGMTDFIIPPKIPEQMQRRIQDLALRLHNLLGCRDVSRVDIMISEQNEPYILEINTIPGFTNLSDLPAEARAEGYTFDELIQEIVTSAFGGGSG